MAVTAAELLFGVATMHAGRRKDSLASKLAIVLGDLFEGRVLPFDGSAAVEYARLASSRMRIGRTVGFADTQIAAVAVSAGAGAVVTRTPPALHRRGGSLGQSLADVTGQPGSGVAAVAQEGHGL